MKKGIPTHTFFRVVFFRHMEFRSRRKPPCASRRLFSGGNAGALPVSSEFFFLIPSEGNKKSRQLGSHLRKEAERIPAGKTPKERSSLYNNIVALLYPFPPHIRRRGVASLPSVADTTPTVAPFRDAPFPIDEPEGLFPVLGSTLRSGNHEQIRTPSRLRSFPPNIFNRS
jgi:hypothetical protein